MKPMRMSRCALCIFIASALLAMLASVARLRKTAAPDRPPGDAFAVGGIIELTHLVDARHHTGSIVFSPNGGSLALPEFDGGRVEVWNLDTGKVRVLEDLSHVRGIRAIHVAFARNGQSLAVAYEEPEKVAVWDLLTDAEKAHIPVPPGCWVGDLAFVEGDRTLVTILQSAGRFASVLWSLERRTLDNKGVPNNSTDQLRPPSQGQSSNQHSVVPPGWSVATVRWDASRGISRDAHSFGPSLEFKALSPDGRYVVLVGKDELPIVFDVVTAKRAFAPTIKGGYVFSDDGAVLLGYDGQQVCLWETPAGTVAKKFAFASSCLPRGYPSYKNRLSLSPDKKVLAIGGFMDVRTVGLIDLESGKILDTFECCPKLMFCDVIQFAPSGRILATDTSTVTEDDRVVKPLLRFWKVPDYRGE